MDKKLRKSVERTLNVTKSLIMFIKTIPKNIVLYYDIPTTTIFEGVVILIKIE